MLVPTNQPLASSSTGARNTVIYWCEMAREFTETAPILVGSVGCVRLGLCSQKQKSKAAMESSQTNSVFSSPANTCEYFVPESSAPLITFITFCVQVQFLKVLCYK